MQIKNWFTFFLICAAGMTHAQEVIKLYDVVPNSKRNHLTEKKTVEDDGIMRVSDVTVPEMIMYRPEKPNGTSVIICPGGAYKILAFAHEGTEVAEAFNQWGVTAFVLKYRLPNDEAMLDKSIAPLQDAERAIQIIRKNAKAWNLQPKKIGIMGFSAGGHLAASLSTRYQEQLIENPKRISFRPDFSILVYPVISFTDSLTHSGSRSNLLGPKPSAAKIKKYSNELQVNAKTPPAFLVHAKDDKAVFYQHSTTYYNALLKNNVAAEIKYFDKGGHGFGMHNNEESGDWMNELKQWMTKQKLLPK